MSFLNRIKKVYVLGAGPAGLLAAQAVHNTTNMSVTVFSQPDLPTLRPKKSELHGCQYLHSAIPDVTSDTGVKVDYQLLGGVEGYRAKVYGDRWQGTVSPDEFGPEEPHLAWDLRAAYDKLWQWWQATIVPTILTPVVARALYDDPSAITISSIPAPAICRDMENHKFSSVGVYAIGEAPGGRSMPFDIPDMSVVCNGEEWSAWYRAARVFGRQSIEWPGGRKPPIHGVVPVSKPLSTDCGCWLGKGGMRVGRYGKWTKGVLVHSAYYDTVAAL